jgi:hypothetical protein
VLQRDLPRFFYGYATGRWRRENLEEAALTWLALQRSQGTEDHDAELDTMADELSAMGVPDADAWADAQRDDDEPDDEPCEVWPENADAVNVFIRCTWQRQSVNDGMTQRMLPTGIAAGEVRDVAELLGVDRERWPRLLDDVRLMVGAVLPELQRM